MSSVPVERKPASSSEATSNKPPILSHVGQLTDRAIQKIVGGNSFLRGRLYVRRGVVNDMDTSNLLIGGKINVRNQEEPYSPSVKLDGDRLISQCNCAGWRGPTGHCKHVAAILVAFRNQERPEKSKQSQEARAQKENRAQREKGPQHENRGNRNANNNDPNKKRRQKKRRSKNGTLSNGRNSESLEFVSMREIQHQRKSQGRKNRSSEGPNIEAWMPANAMARPLDLEYRLAIRSASMAVTAVVSGTRSAVPIGEVLSTFNAVHPHHRKLLRALERHAVRGQASTAELRGEDAAEVLSMLKNKRVLLEPASMELRFADEPLRPRIELDKASNLSLRARVVFFLETSNRRFSLSNGEWFEGTPCWHIDTTEGVARPVIEQVTPAWLQRLYRSPSLVYSMNDLPELLTDLIPKVSSTIGAELPDLTSVTSVVDAPPHFVLRVTGDIVGADAKLHVKYNDQEFEVPADTIPPPLAVLPPEQRSNQPRVVRRDVGAEMEAVQKLFDAGFDVSEEDGELFAQGDDAIHFWTSGIRELPEAWETLIPDDLVDVKIRGESVTPNVRVSSGVDWLNLDVTFLTGKTAVDEVELRQCLESGRKLVRLEDGSFAPVNPDDVSEVLSRMAEIYAGNNSEKKRLGLSQAGRVQDLLALVDGAKVTSPTKTLFEKINDVGGVELIPKPRTLKATLRPYQKIGFSWLAFLHKIKSGGILADDMGLGKTLQAIALLLWAKPKKKKMPSLVIAPTSVVPNWQREIEKFAPSLKTVVWQGPDRHDLKDEAPGADVIITSYALIRRDEEFLAELDLNYVILDEAQHIKNPLSHTARSVKKLQSLHRLALTGTPIENRLSEIWSIFDFVSPGLLGDLRSFEHSYARPIDRGDEKAVAKLRATIQPFILRRIKSQVAKDLPEKIEQEIIVPLAEEQSKLYKQILKEVRDSVLSEVEKKGIGKSQIQILAALTRLRQVACDPRLTKLSKDWTHDDSGKLGALTEILQEAISGGHRVLIFSQFVEMLKLMEQVLKEEKIDYEYLDGSTKNRLQKVDRFNEDESIAVFLISLKAGGTGLNLTGADTVVHFDPWWNPAVEDQATDRAHRIGQTRMVNVYRLIAKNTVEEKILKLSAKKRQLVSNVLSTEGSPLKGLTKADVQELFSE